MSLTLEGPRVARVRGKYLVLLYFDFQILTDGPRMLDGVVIPLTLSPFLLYYCELLDKLVGIDVKVINDIR